MSAPLGLCADCLHARIVRSDRGSVFLRCARAADDPRLPRYPRLPVHSCHAYEPGEPAPADRAAAEPS